MPLLKSLGVHVPVILVASKQDLSEMDNNDLRAVQQSSVHRIMHLSVHSTFCLPPHEWGISFDVFT